MAIEVNITVAGKERKLSLAAPKSMAVRYEVVGAGASNGLRAYCAALAACWQGPGRPKASYAESKYEPLVFGGRVCDELLESGWSLEAVLEAGKQAFDLLTSSLLPITEAAEIEKNSVAPSGASSGE